MGESLKSKRPVVLVVDDEPLIRMDVADGLAEADLEVIEAGNADAAISILSARTDIAVIVTDIEMAGSMDGVRLAWLVRDRWPPVQIVVMSGKNRAPELPAHSTFFAKPYERLKLVEAVQGAAGQSAQ